MSALYSGEKNRAMPVVTKTCLCLLAPRRDATVDAYVCWKYALESTGFDSLVDSDGFDPLWC
jgi:hypothetical protein